MQRERLPQRLTDLGFVAHNADGVAYITPPLCAVPAGPFLMGSDPARDIEANDAEQPRHTVTLPAYHLARYPVTVAEYACAVRAKVVREPPIGTLFLTEWEDQLRRLDSPIVCVSWHDAVAYAVWLAKLTGQPWRLPTEAEWEKAARGADGRIYPWGDVWDARRANTSDGGPMTATPVGSYPTGASPYGAQDLAGNVWEWTSSLYKPYNYVVSDGRERPDAPDYRVLRGGSWNYRAQGARAARRGNSDPSFVRGSFGFRLMLP